MKKNKFEKIQNNAYAKMAVYVLGLVLYAVTAALPGVCFLFWPFWLCVALVVAYLLILPAFLLLRDKQKLTASLYFIVPAAIYAAMYIYLKMRAWHEKIGVNIAASLAKTDGFGLLSKSGYATQPRLIFLGVSGVILSALYSICYMKKARWRWYFVALSAFLITAVFVFWEYIKLYLKS